LINIGPDKGRVMSNIIVERQPATVVELGGYLGYSAILFACTMREVKPKDAPFKLWSLEYSPEFSAIARELIEIAGLERDIEVVTGAAGDSLRLLRAEDRVQYIDMLFIDHGEGGIELYESDLKICEELGLLKSGACIVADNVLRPGAPEYRKYVRSHSGFRSQGVKALIMPGEFEVI
jgi:catechol O-methyltransferase